MGQVINICPYLFGNARPKQDKKRREKANRKERNDSTLRLVKKKAKVP